MPEIMLMQLAAQSHRSLHTHRIHCAASPPFFIKGGTCVINIAWQQHAKLLALSVVVVLF